LHACCGVGAWKAKRQPRSQSNTSRATTGRIKLTARGRGNRMFGGGHGAK
jgi:hypothetical protein